MRTKAASQPAEKGGWRTFLALATDPWMLSAPALAMTSLAYLVLAALSAVSQQSSLLGALGTTVVALLLQVLLLWGSFRWFLGRDWWNRHLVTRTTYVVVVVLISGAVSRALLRAIGDEELARVESAGMWFQRAAALLLITAGWTALDSYRGSLAREEALQEQLRESRAVAVQTVEQQRRDVIERIREMLNEALREPATFNERSLDRVRERIRTLSHELQGSAPSYQPRMPRSLATPGWRVVVQSVLSRPLIQPLLMAFTVTAFFFAQTVSTDVSSATTAPTDGEGLQVSVDMGSFALSLAYLLVVFFVTWIFSIVAVRLTRPRLSRLSLGTRAVWVLATPVLLAVVVQIVVEVAYAVPGFAGNLDDDLTARLFSTIPIFLIAALIVVIRAVGGLFTVAQVNQRELTEQLQWQVARANETLVQERRHLSLQVHGPLQSTVASVSLALQEAGHAEDSGSSEKRAREKIAEVVDRLELGPTRQRSLANEIGLLRSTWAGVGDIEVDAYPAVLEDIDADWVSAGTVADVLIEAVANAAVHGGASKVRISMRALNVRTLLVEVANNGSLSAQESGSGLGSKMLDDVSVGWQLEDTEDGIVLKVWLPTVPDVPGEDGLAPDLAKVLDGTN